MRVKQKGVHVQTEESARYDRVMAVKDKVRTLTSATNAFDGMKLDGNHVLMPYLVR